MLEILQAPNQVLSTPAAPIKAVDNSANKLISDMTKALLAATDPIGVGLAAPQVGKNLQLFIAKPKAKSKIMVFINPKVLELEPLKKQNKKKKGGKKLEGCLSLKDIWGEVERSETVTIEYLDEKGQKIQKTFKGFLSTIIQHEIDHLNGILFTARVLEQKGTLYHSEKDEEGHDVFEKIKI